MSTLPKRKAAAIPLKKEVSDVEENFLMDGLVSPILNKVDFPKEKSLFTTKPSPKPKR
jgi:hypothetical protein